MAYLPGHFVQGGASKGGHTRQQLKGKTTLPGADAVQTRHRDREDVGFQGECAVGCEGGV
jgi:hypothetical protein